MLAARENKKPTTRMEPPGKKQVSPIRVNVAGKTASEPALGEELQRYLGNGFLQSLAGNGLPLAHPVDALLQRQCHCGGTCTGCVGQVDAQPGELVAGQGHSLPEPLRAFFETRLGYDFSGVRVHTDVRAAESARALHASSYTVGQDIMFGAGQFSPHTVQGQQRLAHELTHVVQQERKAGSPDQVVSNPKDAAEVEAARISASILALAPENPVAVGVSARPTAMVQRQAWPGEEFSSSPQPGFGLGTTGTSPLRFAFGIRTGQQVTANNLIEWAFEQAGEGVTFADLVRRVTSSHEFTGGSPEEKQRWVSVLRSWEPELNAHRETQELQRWADWALRGAKAAPKGAALVLPQEIEEWESQPIDWEALSNFNRLSPIALPNREYNDGGAARHVIYANNYMVVFTRNGYVYKQGQQEFMQQAGFRATVIAKVYQKTQHLPGLYRFAMELALDFVPLGPAGKIVGFVVKKGVGLARKGAGLVRQGARAVKGLRGGRAAVGARSVRGATSTAARVRPPARGAAPAARQGDEALTAARQSDEAVHIGRQAEVEPMLGAASGTQSWARRAKKLMQSRKFRRAREELQPLLNQINPCSGKANCVPSTIAVDMSLATGKVFKAPVTIEETGFKIMQTEKGSVMVKTFEEIGSKLHHAEAYAGANLKTGADALWKNLYQAGHGSRAIVADSTLVKIAGVSHAYNVINWRGMVIAIDGQTRTMMPFAVLLARLKELGKTGALRWARTN